jgi:predicted nucleotidyltransferase component of viral defense system
MSGNSLLSRYKHAHEQNMKRILSLLFSSQYKDILWFKGGTLAYLCYDLDRFSTDIDIDILDLNQEEEVITFLNNELPLLWDVWRPLLWKDLHRWKFKYNAQARNIKIELNKRKSTYTNYEYRDIDGLNVQCQTPTSMATNKLLALWNRWYNRDLYDTHFFLKQWFTYNAKIIEDKENTSIQEFIKHILEEIPHHFQSNTVLHQIWEVLTTDKQKARVKSSLIDETIKLLTLYLQQHPWKHK